MISSTEDIIESQDQSNPAFTMVTFQDKTNSTSFETTGQDHSSDPRNWSLWRKRLVFVALMSSSILVDGGMTWGATLVVPQALEWRVSVARSATSLNYGILLQGFGGVVAVPLIDAFGRFPLWFWPQLITMGTVICCCFARSWTVFTILRTLQGLFGTVPQVIGLPIIYDMYTPQDWPRMINIWGTTFLVGPFLGPAVAGYLLQCVDWRGAFGVLAGLYGISTLLVLLLGRETYYCRSKGIQQTHRLKGVVGIGSVESPRLRKFSLSSKAIFVLTFRPALLLVGVSTMINFTWPIGITTTIDSFVRAPPYLFGNVAAASIRFAGVFGSLLGFCFGYIFNRFVFGSDRGTRRWRSEERLHGVWIPAGCMVCGLLTYGLTIHYSKSWIGLAFGWAMVSVGVVGTTVAITAFGLEKYPDCSTAVSAIINMWRTCGGFAVGYFQPAWISRNGVGVVFGIQALVVAVSIVLLVLPVIVMGRRGARRSSL